jgi:hypothetical protein
MADRRRRNRNRGSEELATTTGGGAKATAAAVPRLAAIGAPLHQGATGSIYQADLPPLLTLPTYSQVQFHTYALDLQCSTDDVSPSAPVSLIEDWWLDLFPALMRKMQSEGRFPAVTLLDTPANMRIWLTDLAHAYVGIRSLLGIAGAGALGENSRDLASTMYSDGRMERLEGTIRRFESYYIPPGFLAMLNSLTGAFIPWPGSPIHHIFINIGAGGGAVAEPGDLKTGANIDIILDQIDLNLDQMTSSTADTRRISQVLGILFPPAKVDLNPYHTSLLDWDVFNLGAAEWADTTPAPDLFYVKPDNVNVEGVPILSHVTSHPLTFCLLRPAVGSEGNGGLGFTLHNRWGLLARANDGSGFVQTRSYDLSESTSLLGNSSAGASLLAAWQDARSAKFFTSLAANQTDFSSTAVLPEEVNVTTVTLGRLVVETLHMLRQIWGVL